MSSAIGESSVDRLTDFIDEQKWPQIISDLHHIETAFQAYQEGRISDRQLGTVILFDHSFRSGKIAPETIPLFIHGDINLVAKRCIAQSIQAVRVMNAELPSAYLFSHLPAEKLDEFFEKMKQQPHSEQNFILTQRIPSFPNLHLLLSKIGLNGFFLCQSEGKSKQVVPSFGMMQTLLDVKYGDKAPKLDPTRVSVSQNIGEEPFPRDVMARLQLAYALLLGATPTNEPPENVLRSLLKDVQLRPMLREEIAEALNQMPRDPFLQLVSKIIKTL